MMPILLALILFFSVATPANALEGSQPTATIAVNGDVLYWEGEEIRREGDLWSGSASACDR